MKQIFKNCSNIIHNTSDTHNMNDTQTMQYLSSLQMTSQESQQSQCKSDMCTNTGYTIYNESQEEETTARHASQCNENDNYKLTYITLDEHYSQDVGNRRLVEIPKSRQDNIDNRYLSIEFNFI